jgi:hypothetical protein
MGLYLDPPLGGQIQSKQDWLKAHGRKITLVEVAELSRDPEQMILFYWPTQWGGNIGVGHNITEIRRMVASAQADAIYVVPKAAYELAKSRGVR